MSEEAKKKLELSLFFIREAQAILGQMEADIERLDDELTDFEKRLEGEKENAKKRIKTTDKELGTRPLPRSKPTE